MSILNVITATVAHCSNVIAIETTYHLTRSRKLTVRGAQRILRKTNPSVIVSRVQTFIDER
jgi:hypothetical protein